MKEADVQSIVADIAADKYILKSYGSTVLFPGFTVLYTEGLDAVEDDDERQQLPNLKKGDDIKKKMLTPA